MRLLYIHSFQSLIWNKIVSRRIKEFGLKPIVGDMVLMVGSNENALIDEAIIPENENCNQEEDDSQTVVNRQEVKILTADDLENYTIYDLVLPLPGFDVKYPNNEVKSWYKELLEEVGLSLEMTKQKVKYVYCNIVVKRKLFMKYFRTYTLSGNYRKILSKAENVNWYTMGYNDPNDNLLISDFEELRDFDEPVDAPR